MSVSILSVSVLPKKNICCIHRSFHWREDSLTAVGLAPPGCSDQTRSPRNSPCHHKHNQATRQRAVSFTCTFAISASINPSSIDDYYCGSVANNISERRKGPRYRCPADSGDHSTIISLGVLILSLQSSCLDCAQGLHWLAGSHWDSKEDWWHVQDSIEYHPLNAAIPPRCRVYIARSIVLVAS